MDKNSDNSELKGQDAEQDLGPDIERERSGRFKAMLTIAVLVLLFVAGIGGGYLFFLKKSQVSPTVTAAPAPRQRGDATSIVIFFPSEGRLKSETREAPASVSRSSVARATVEEFLKGPQSGIKSYIPEGASLLGIYDGADGILYVDLSGSFRRNLRVDAMNEYLLMRGLYESILANVYGVADVKVLIDGAEVESLGGHMSLLRPLGDTVSQTIVEE